MYLAPFFQADHDIITITPEQGSAFAKQVANDFNPLHDADSRRFCVPGDLLFALNLAWYGLSQRMTFNYTGMVGKGVDLVFPLTGPAEDAFDICDRQGKPYLSISREGEVTQDMDLIEAFTRAYVAFSGQSFPHILVPLMQKHQVMIHPDKPMVIYENMAFDFDRFDAEKLGLKLGESALEMKGKRGLVRINFDIVDGERCIGSGYKTMVLSSLRPYEQSGVDKLIERYEAAKTAYIH
jgi:hypothetical protein